jgi:BirA family biotin operon repressor/biotin-[acetyl-CoA-carboxylase] ligase
MLKTDLGQKLTSVNSTNEWIKDSKIPFGSWVIAEEQTLGKGRGTNKWQTLGEDPLIFSGKIQIPSHDLSLPLFSLFTAKAVLQNIFRFFPDRMTDTTIKWPNDIYRGNSKLSGILIETEFSDGLYSIVIGIGLNFYGKKIPEDLVSKATFVSDVPLGEGIFEQFTFGLVEEINSAIVSMMDPGQILRELIWIEEYSFLKEKVIETEENGKILRGRVLGFDEFGFLLIMTESGEKIELMDSSPNFRII